MLIEIHLLQNHAPSNPNRDDLGAPKTAMFGGQRRARISSQCLKRSIRLSELFKAALEGHLGQRTKLLPWLVGERLKKSQIPVEEHARIVAACQRLGSTKEKNQKGAKGKDERPDPRPKTPQLIFLGPGHVDEFVARLERLRSELPEAYAFFLDPSAGFQELVREQLADVDLPEKEKDKIMKQAWMIAKSRLEELRRNPDAEPEIIPDGELAAPGAAVAELLVRRLAEFFGEQPNRYKQLTAKPTSQERELVKEEAAAGKPSKSTWDRFMEALRVAEHHHAADIGLFGRMTTSAAFEDVEAAMEVAHAISANEVVPEVDYFTGVDDDPYVKGAAHVGENQFNSSIYYKYFSLDWDALCQHFAGPEPTDQSEAEGQQLAGKTLEAFLEAVFFTTPTGKRKGFAHNNLPDGVLIEVKKRKIPTSYANAFVKPATPSRDSDLVAESIRQLAHYVGTVVSRWEIPGQRWWFTTRPDVSFVFPKMESGTLPVMPKTRSALVKAILDYVNNSSTESQP